MWLATETTYLLIDRSLISLTFLQLLLADRYHGDMARRLQPLVCGVLTGQVKGYAIPPALRTKSYQSRLTAGQWFFSTHNQVTLAVTSFRSDFVGFLKFSSGMARNINSCYSEGAGRNAIIFHF